MLDAWKRESIDEVIDRDEREGGDPRTKIVRAGVLTISGDRLLPMPSPALSACCSTAPQDHRH